MKKKSIQKINIQRPITPLPKMLKTPNVFYGIFVKNINDISGLSYYFYNNVAQIFLTKTAATKQKLLASRVYGNKFVIKKVKIINYENN